MIDIDFPKCNDKILKYGNIRDIPISWLKEELWRYNIYEMWKGMWRRVNEHRNYKDCSICHDYIRLSNYLLDILRLDNFNIFKENPKGWSIDKDIKIPGNKEYKFEALSLVTRSDNSKERQTRSPFCPERPKTPVIGISNNSILIFKSSRYAEALGFDASTIIKCCKGKRPSHKGYRWYYLNYKHGKRLRKISSYNHL